MKYFKPLLFTICLLLFVQLADAQQGKALYGQPILISSAGQSADVKLVGMLAKKQKLQATVKAMATEKDLEGMATLIVVPGFSSKGLGAAGVSQADELDRVEKLIKAANEKEIPIILVHIGGNARRKGNSDMFNTLVAENCKHMLVVAQADEDKFFTNLAAEHKLPLELFPKIVKVAAPMGKLFKR